jgi:hypothetical protein
MYLQYNLNGNLNTSDVIAICAIMISVFSVIISLIYNRKNLNLSQKNNVLSKKPILCTILNKDIDKGKVEIGIENYGIGPAIIKKISFKSIHCESENSIKVFETIKLDDNSNLNIILRESFYSELTSNFGISENKKTILYKATIVNPSIFTKNKFFNHIENCKIIVEYYDIFDNKFILNENIGIEKTFTEQING